MKKSINEASELEKLEDAIKMFQDKIKKQGNVTNARDEEHLENLIRVYKEMGGKNVKESLNENQEEILKKILRNIDKYIQRTGKGQKHVNDLRSKIEAKLMAINPNVTKSSAMKTFKGTFDKQNESTLLELSDIERLLEYIKEADKKDSPKPKSKADSNTPKKEDEEISPSAALQKFKKSSGASNLMQDLRRMSSKSERATAIIQLMKSLPGISDTTIRRAIVNAFKTKG